MKILWFPNKRQELPKKPTAPKRSRNQSKSLNPKRSPSWHYVHSPRHAPHTTNRADHRNSTDHRSCPSGTHPYRNDRPYPNLLNSGDLGMDFEPNLRSWYGSRTTTITYYDDSGLTLFWRTPKFYSTCTLWYILEPFLNPSLFVGITNVYPCLNFLVLPISISISSHCLFGTCSPPLLCIC